MEDKQQIKTWPGERKPLPIEKSPTHSCCRCLMGEGYLRIMSSARRQQGTQGGKFTIMGGDIATLTAKKTMLFLLN